MLSKVLKLSDNQTPSKKDSPTKAKALITQVEKSKDTLFKFPELFCLDKCLASLYKTFSSKRNSIPLLPAQSDKHKGRKTLILDLDETLVHSTFEINYEADLTLPVRVDERIYIAYVMKRPGVEEFLARVCDLYEVVVFTASMKEYAEPLIRLLDPYNRIPHILFRDSCSVHRGKYVKDLSRLGRKLQDVILVDNSPSTFRFQPENAYHISDFFDNKSDDELQKLLPFLEHLVKAEDVRPLSKHWRAYEKGEEINAAPIQQTKTKVSFVSRAKTIKNITHETKVKSCFRLESQERLGKQLRPGEAEALRVIRNLKLKRSRQLENAKFEGNEDRIPTIETIEETCTDSTNDLEDEGEKNFGRQVGGNVLSPSITDDIIKAPKSKKKKIQIQRKGLNVKTIEYASYNRRNDQGPDSQNKLLEAEPETDNDDKVSKDESGSIQDLSLMRETLNINSPVSNIKLMVGKEKI